VRWQAFPMPEPLVEEWDADLRSGDPLAFPGYRELLDATERDSVRTGRTEHHALIEGDFSVIGGSMGVVHGERVDVGDRRLVLDVPPIYDSPASLGAYDPTTGVWWSADTSATEVDRPVVDVAELEPQRWAEATTAMAHEIAPWLALVDAARFAVTVEAVEALGASTIVGAHTPVIGPRMIDAAWSVVRSLPSRGRRG